MRGYRQFTDEQVQKVARLYTEGYTRRDIAMSVRLPYHVVAYILYKILLITRPVRTRSAVIKHKARLDDKVINKIIVLTNFGYHHREIAEDQQIPEVLVRQVIEKAKEKRLIEKKV